MATKGLLRPRDPLALAKLIGDIATGLVADVVERGEGAGAAPRGTAGGKAGGKERALRLSAEERTKIAQMAASARWKKSQ